MLNDNIEKSSESKNQDWNMDLQKKIFFNEMNIVIYSFKNEMKMAIYSNTYIENCSK